MLLASCAPAGPDTGPCIETYVEEIRTERVDAEVPVRVVADEREIRVLADGVRLRFPRLGLISGFNGEVYDGVGHLRAGPSSELTISVIVNDLDGDLVFQGGDIPGVRPDIAATFAATEGITTRCSTTRLRGDFASAEFRSADPPTTLEAGEERILQIDGRSYLAGVPWAFEFDESNVFVGWAYVMAVR